MEKIVIRKTIVVVTLKIMVLQILFSFFYITTSLISNFIKNFNSDVFPHLVAWDSLIIFLFTVIQLFIVGYILLQWTLDKYIIFDDRIEHRTGILFRKINSYNIMNVETIHLEKDVLGKLFGYGSIELQSPTLEEHIILYNIPSAGTVVQIIRKKVIALSKSKIIHISPTNNIRPLLNN
jgi:uncharacterized membrane protein YdbT with pleckstrin-like domain